ncbi:MAG: peptide-methionine (R)-S-oxide reductase [Flavobacteriia bacterium]|nr:MAG: peptide-methionine (R)-S-oxide reductase [Flavobacteriia bacterium]
MVSCKGQRTQDTLIQKQDTMTYKIQKTDAEWRAILSDEQYRILREKGTEYPGTGDYYMHFEEGTYVCAGCGTPLFESNHKFESRCGWPSFDDAIEGKVLYKRDTSHGMIRTEILCANCDGHLGHVFDDGPRNTTGKRYCVNSVSLDFKP